MTIKKTKGQDKVAYVMREFEAGKLKTSAGKIVTDRNQALAIAMHMAGLSEKSLKKAEIRNKLMVYKSELTSMLKKDMMNDKSVKAEIIKLFRQPGQIEDKQVHALADRLQISPNELEDHIYEILRSIVAGGKSKGTANPADFDPAEIEMGKKVEAEHSADPDIQMKIILDHLTENAKYYSEGRDAGTFPELKKTVQKDEGTSIEITIKNPQVPIEPAMDYEGEILAGELPVDMTTEQQKLFKTVYLACRKGGADKLKCSQLALSEARNAMPESIAK